MKKSSRGAARKMVEISDWSKVAAMGIDLGDRFSRLVALDAGGERIGEERLPTTAEAFEKRLGGIPRQRIAIETGTHSPWVSRLLQRLGHEVTVANSRKLRLIYENPNKNDSVDAEYLARVLRVDPHLLAPVEHRAERAQQHLAVLRARDALVRARTCLINHIRGAVKSMGTRVPACSAPAFAKRASAMLPEQLRAALEPLVTIIQELNGQIVASERKIGRLLEHEYSELKVLTQIRGVGALTAVAYGTTIGQRGRFQRSRTVGAWLGLTPGQKASGQQDPQQRITRQGDDYLRRLLINCAHYILGPFGEDCDLRRHGLALAARGGKNAKKRAVVAVARKLAVLLHRLWRTQESYEPLRGAKSVAPAAA